MTPGLENQSTYWNTAGATKTFTHPIDFTWLHTLDKTARLLDYGCGYGRITALAHHHGFTDIEGVDSGVFETSDGAVCRHHSTERLHETLRDHFTVTTTRELTLKTMNGNPARAMQILAKRPAS